MQNNKQSRNVLNSLHVILNGRSMAIFHRIFLFKSSLCLQMRENNLFSHSDLFLTTIKARMLEGSDYTNSVDHITTSCLFPPTLTSCLLSATSCSRN